MMTDVKINVHIRAVIQAVDNVILCNYRIICFENDILFSTQFVLTIILIDE